MSIDPNKQQQESAKLKQAEIKEGINCSPRGPKDMSIYERGLATMQIREAAQKQYDKLMKDEPGINPKDAQGQKKVPLHLVPPSLRIYVAQAMADGAAKYGPYNWRDKPIFASVYYSACMRHMDAYWDGEEVAEDSGVHHLAHAAACLALVIDAIECGVLKDDRPIKGAAADLMKRIASEKEDEGAAGVPKWRTVNCTCAYCIDSLKEREELVVEYKTTQNDRRAEEIARHLAGEAKPNEDCRRDG